MQQLTHEVVQHQCNPVIQKQLIMLLDIQLTQKLWESILPVTDILLKNPFTFSSSTSSYRSRSDANLGSSRCSTFLYTSLLTVMCFLIYVCISYRPSQSSITGCPSVKRSLLVVQLKLTFMIHRWLDEFRLFHA